MHFNASDPEFQNAQKTMFLAHLLFQNQERKVQTFNKK